MKKIVLASTSPRRKNLLSVITPHFEVISSDYEEDMSLKLPHKKLVKLLALGKARAAAKRFKSGVVIGADTFVVMSSKRFGKPKDKKDMIRMLKEQSGKVQSVLTGHAIIDIDKNKTYTRVVETKLKLRKLSLEEILRYAEKPEGLDKAGGWAIQSENGGFVEWIKGDFTSVFGLSVTEVSKILKKLKIL